MARRHSMKSITYDLILLTCLGTRAEAVGANIRDRKVRGGSEGRKQLLDVPAEIERGEELEAQSRLSAASTSHANIIHGSTGTQSIFPEESSKSGSSLNLAGSSGERKTIRREARGVGTAVKRNSQSKESRSIGLQEFVRGTASRSDIAGNTCLAEAQCSERRQQLGIPVALYDVGNFPDHGCFSKNGRLYWGRGGTAEQKGASPLSGVKERVWCDPAAPTVSPTFSPTIEPSFSPTVSPTRAPVSLRWRWDNGLSRDDGRNGDSNASKSSPTFSPTLSPTYSPTGSPFSLRWNIDNDGRNGDGHTDNDGWDGDGHSGKNPSPSFSPTVVPTEWKDDGWKDDGWKNDGWNGDGHKPPSPSRSPSISPTFSPTDVPTRSPIWKSDGWNDDGWKAPAKKPTKKPTHSPSLSPTLSPSISPTASPSNQPTSEPTNQPTQEPTFEPSSSEPTFQPSNQPSNRPSNQPSDRPSSQPSLQPSSEPTFQPSNQPSNRSSNQPSGRPSDQPSSNPSTPFPTFSTFDTCIILPFAPFSNCAQQGESGPCCVQGQGGPDRLVCRSNCQSCQIGISSNDCCAAATVGSCSGSTPFCCRPVNGNADQFTCIADAATCGD